MDLFKERLFFTFKKVSLFLLGLLIGAATIIGVPLFLATFKMLGLLLYKAILVVLVLLAVIGVCIFINWLFIEPFKKKK